MIEHLGNRGPVDDVLSRVHQPGQPGRAGEPAEAGTGAAIRSTRRLAAAATACFLVLVACYLLWPRSVAWVPDTNLVPLHTIRAELRLPPWQAAARICGAIGLMVPFGVLVPMIFSPHRPLRFGSLVQTTALGAIVAVGFQLARTTVPGRVCDIDTALLGTLGVLLGQLVLLRPARRLARWWIARRVAERRRETPQPAPRQPAEVTGSGR